MLPEAVTSIYWFALSSLLPIFGYVTIINLSPLYLRYQGAASVLGITYLASNFIIFLSLRGFRRQVAIRSTFLGTIFAVGYFISTVPSQSWNIFGWYMCFMAFFHFSEFFIIAIANPASLSLDSFMLTHSYSYGVAVAACLIEYFTEQYFMPNTKDVRIVSQIGFIMCVFGEVFRKSAILTASNNFNHVVQTEKRHTHSLVTHGVYQFCRHPSYVGWFYWCIGTQLVLVNPICTVAYTITSWIFFKDRVTREEIALLKFFSTDYGRYKKKVPSGLPFINGF